MWLSVLKAEVRLVTEHSLNNLKLPEFQGNKSNLESQSRPGGPKNGHKCANFRQLPIGG